MVFETVVRDGKIMPNFIGASLKINVVEYLKILEEVILPSIKKNYDPTKSMFIQLMFTLPYHGLIAMQTFLKREKPLFVTSMAWLPGYQIRIFANIGCGPMLRISLCSTPWQCGSLKTSVRIAFRTVKEESAIKTCLAFRASIQKALDAEKGCIDKIIKMYR